MLLSLREAGVVSWGMGDKKRSNTFWEAALKYSKYDFEYRLATVSITLDIGRKGLDKEG
jgi:hypothetical protein